MSNEIIQRVDSKYVSDDCMQTMVPYEGDCITYFNGDGIQYHYKDGSDFFTNKYYNDDRKNRFPYSDVPYHRERQGFRKRSFVNQLLSYDQPYIKIADGMITENYAIKDGDFAYLIIKNLSGYYERESSFNCERANKLFDSLNNDENIILSTFNGAIIDACFPSKEKIINEFKLWNKFTGWVTAEDRPDLFRNWIVVDDLIMVIFENNQIKSIKSIVVRFRSLDNYKIEMYNFPITSYTLEYAKMLEQRCLVDAKEPRIKKRLLKK